MKKEDVILIVEPERIIGLELQKALERNGYSVVQSHTTKLFEEFADKQKVKVVIVNVDKAKIDYYMDLKKHFCPKQVSFISISSGSNVIKEREGVKFSETFFKPFDAKTIVSYVDKCLMTSGSE